MTTGGFGVTFFKGETFLLSEMEKKGKDPFGVEPVLSSATAKYDKLSPSDNAIYFNLSALRMLLDITKLAYSRQVPIYVYREL